MFFEELNQVRYLFTNNSVLHAELICSINMEYAFFSFQENLNSNIFLKPLRLTNPNWLTSAISQIQDVHFKKTIFLKKCFLVQKSLNSIGENNSKKEKTTPNFSSFLNLKSSEKWMLFLAHQKVKNPLFIVGFRLFLYHIIVHCQYIIFRLISYKLIAVHILVHTHHIDYAKMAFIYHLVVSLDIGSSTRADNMFRIVCVLVTL